MADCFSCGENFTSDTNALLRAYKKQFEKLGIVRYFYKLHANDTIKICRSNSFNTILENEIKPNLQKGANYAHISEFR